MYLPYLKINFFLLLWLVLLAHRAFPQQIISTERPDILIQPTPRNLFYSGYALKFNTNSENLLISHQSAESAKAASYLKYIIEKKYALKVKPVIVEDNKPWAGIFHIKMIQEKETDAQSDQYYRIHFNSEQNELVLSSTGQLGLLYAVVTLSELFYESEEHVLLSLYNIEDWPAFQRRIFPAVVEKEDVEPLLDFALRHKIETVALAHRQYPWFEVDERLGGIFAEIKKWKEQYGGPHVMQMHNIYDTKQIKISSGQDVESLFNVIETGLDSGVDKLMILADDTPPFEFGEGYVLPYEDDRQQFKHMVEAHCYLIKKIKEELAGRNDLIEFYYGPAFYTYEDMNYGDMSQYDGTPWEEQAYQPLKRDLAYLGLFMPEDIFIIWTGPNVRTRVLKEEDIRDWTENLSGRIPFLWDNTIYSHYPFTSTALFTAYENQFPDHLEQITGGNGMAVNGNLNAEEMKVALITANDYLWDPRKYNPKKSLETAMIKRYGVELTNWLFRFKETELALRKKIGERALWFEADSLWQIIRKIRWTTEKNPLYYHLNYNGLKALRMQLKYSIPQPVDEQTFFAECDSMDLQRHHILNKVQVLNPDLSTELYKIISPLPGRNK